VLFSESQEFGRCRGLDVLRGKVVKFDFGMRNDIEMSFPRRRESRVGAIHELPLQIPGQARNDRSGVSTLKVPHMGWNSLNIKQGDNPLFNGIPDKSYFYFVHSYYVVPEEASIISTTTDYGIEFTSSVRNDNIFAVQFHPEKSQTLGLRILRNFGDIVAGR
jgi:glutamine amidotransferase